MSLEETLWALCVTASVASLIGAQKTVDTCVATAADLLRARGYFSSNTSRAFSSIAANAKPESETLAPRTVLVDS